MLLMFSAQLYQGTPPTSARLAAGSPPCWSQHV